ncbi:hypothetical protein EAE92_20605 [Photorhabdus hainanensis]|nr:hypothetical protein [Photorhabdus hainanensis]
MVTQAGQPNRLAGVIQAGFSLPSGLPPLRVRTQGGKKTTEWSFHHVPIQIYPLSYSESRKNLSFPYMLFNKKLGNLND